MLDKHFLAAAGTTGNVTGSGVALRGAYEGLAFQFVVEAKGSTPTVTYKYQGSLDGTNWFDVAYITDASDTAAVTTRTMTDLGAQVAWLSNPVARKYSHFRVVTTANTNITFRAEVYRILSGA